MLAAILDHGGSDSHYGQDSGRSPSGLRRTEAWRSSTSSCWAAAHIACLRIFIDKPEGVTHADCEFISQQVGTILDVEDVIPGGRYTLEVSSPGVERKLTQPREFERFVGHKVKVTLREPVENQRHWVGALSGFAEGIITLEPAPGKSIQFPLEQVEKANLKFEW